jgi:hypothetical protein
MLNDTKKDMLEMAKRLSMPYESYSIDTLADAYCAAKDAGDEQLKNVYIAALILRYWFKIDKMYQSNQQLNLEREEFFMWLYEAIEYACKYRAWQNPSKKVNANQCINQCIETIIVQHYYQFNLAKHRANQNTVSLDTPFGTDDEDTTLGDLLESPETADGHYDDTVMLIQDYINNNKVIEAIIIDTIVSNDVQKHFKKVVKTTDENGEVYRYTEHSSEFWPYKLVQIVSKLPATYKRTFMKRYNIAEEKLSTVLDALGRVNNQKLYKYLKSTLSELRESYVF